MNNAIKQNPSFQSYSDVKSITQTFNQHAELKYFWFGRIYPNGEFFGLASDHQWPEDYFLEQNQLPATATNYDAVRSGIYLPSFDQDQEFGWVDGTIGLIKEKYSIVDPLLFIKKHDHFNEAVLFSLENNNSHAFYMENLDLFENFIFYFKDRANKLIDKASKNLVRLEGYDYATNDSALLNADSKITHKLSPNKYYLQHKGIDIPVTAKEYYCLSRLAHGQQFKSIAQELRLSARTIETHFERIKKKLNLSTREELAAVYWNNKI